MLTWVPPGPPCLQQALIAVCECSCGWHTHPAHTALFQDALWPSGRPSSSAPQGAEGLGHARCRSPGSCRDGGERRHPTITTHFCCNCMSPIADACPFWFSSRQQTLEEWASGKLESPVALHCVACSVIVCSCLLTGDITHIQTMTSIPDLQPACVLAFSTEVLWSEETLHEKETR